MARNVRLDALRTRARELSDTEGDTFISDSELTALANRYLTEDYDIFVSAGPPDRYASTASLANTTGNRFISLPSDFRSLVDVYIVAGGLRTPIPPMPPGSLANYRDPTTANAIELEYVPVAPSLVADGDTFDGVSGWDELIVLRMALRVCQKRDDLARAGSLKEDIVDIRQRITREARSYDRGHPKRVTDLDQINLMRVYDPTQKLACYRLRGSNLEVYEYAWSAP